MYDDNCQLSQASNNIGDELDEEDVPKEDDGCNLFNKYKIKHAASEVPSNTLPSLHKIDLASQHLLNEVSQWLPGFT